MSTGRTAYHVIFAQLLQERAPKGLTFAFDVALTTEPQRADVIIVRKQPVVDTSKPLILERLWEWLPGDTIVEYKSPTRPVRRGDVRRLLGYGAQYHVREADRLGGREELALVLVVASLTPTLDGELGLLGWTRESLGGGYYRTTAQPYALHLVVVDEVARTEHDVLLDLVGHRTMESEEADQWLLRHTIEMPEGLTMEKLEGYDELVQKALDRMPLSVRLKGIKPEELLKGLKPEELRQGLSTQQRILALDDDVLARLPSDYVESLPAGIREEIQRRLSRH
jgi:hypothetical protein